MSKGAGNNFGPCTGTAGQRRALALKTVMRSYLGLVCVTANKALLESMLCVLCSKVTHKVTTLDKYVFSENMFPVK